MIKTEYIIYYISYINIYCKNLYFVLCAKQRRTDELIAGSYVAVTMMSDCVKWY